MSIYENLYNFLVHGQIKLPGQGKYAKLLENELKCLKRIWTPNGFKIKPDPEAIVKTDDSCDALAGAIGSCMKNIYTGFAKGATVYMPHGKNETTWHIGSGSYNDQQIKTYGHLLGY